MKTPKFLPFNLTLGVAFLIGLTLAHARIPKDFFQNSDLLEPSNYLPSGLPSRDNDVVITTPSSVLGLDAANLTVGSLNQINESSYTISNNAKGTTESLLTIGIDGGRNDTSPNPLDVIYLNCAACTLTLQRANGGDGIGPLRISAAGQVNVVQPGATLSISSDLSLVSAIPFTKIGAGTLNLSGQVSGFATPFRVNEGTVNFLAGATTIPGNVVLHANSTVNLYASQGFRGLLGVGMVNLIGSGTRLSLTLAGGQDFAAFGGIITGAGSISFTTGLQKTQTFSGNNTYSGTTDVVNGILQIEGSTSGQGNYSIQGGGGTSRGSLAGNGTIGLSANSSVTLTANGTLAPGSQNGIGTLTVTASGTGGVIFQSGSLFAVHIGAVGSSDQLALSGGSLDLTSPNEALSLVPLANGFDGTDYTIATFPQNNGSGVFNTVQGLPAGYTLLYQPTSITVAAIQQPLQLLTGAGRKMHGSAGAFDIDLLPANAVECRDSGGSHTLVFTFTNFLVSGSASVTQGNATIAASPTFSGKTMIVELTDVADAQKLVVTLHQVTDRFAQTQPETALTLNFLAGDVTGNKLVSGSDVGQTKALSGSSTTSGNFRADVNVSGLITASDITFVKSRSGNFVGP